MTAIVLTHGHNDHITAARALRAATGAPIWFHPADRMVWDAIHAEGSPDRDLAEGVEFAVAETAKRALHPPGTHRAAPACAPDLGTVSAVFQGGPGATGRSHSDRPTILAPIREGLPTLPDDTVVKTGQGEDTMIDVERPIIG